MTTALWQKQKNKNKIFRGIGINRKKKLEIFTVYESSSYYKIGYMAYQNANKH
jgi:hypothetical protein